LIFLRFLPASSRFFQPSTPLISPLSPSSSLLHQDLDKVLGDTMRRQKPALVAFGNLFSGFDYMYDLSGYTILSPVLATNVRLFPMAALLIEDTWNGSLAFLQPCPAGRFARCVTRVYSPLP